MKKILLPVDGSKRSIRTVEMVKQLCDPADSDITVVKVVSAQLYINSMDEIKHNAEKAQPELTAVADMLPGYQVKTQVLLGSAPGVEIVEYAKESGTEMIIMTRSSEGPCGSWAPWPPTSSATPLSWMSLSCGRRATNNAPRDRPIAPRQVSAV